MTATQTANTTRSGDDQGFKIAYTIREACDATGIGRTTLYELIGAGRVRAVKVGARTLIPRSSLTALFDEPPAAA